MAKEFNKIEFNPTERSFLHHLGRTETGRDLIAILKRARNHYTSTDTIDMTRNTKSQLEGRNIFKAFINDFIEEIETKDRPKRKIEIEDYS